MSTTLLQLRDACKDRADMSGSTGPDQFIPDPTWNQYINASFAEFHDIVVRNDVRFYLTSSQFAIPQGSNTQALPADFMIADGVERSWDNSGLQSTWYDIYKFPWRERNWGNNPYWSLLLPPQVRYNIAGNNLVFQPNANASGLYQLWYYPIAPVLVNDSDTFDDQRYWFEYVIVDVAMKALQKEESDVSVLMAQKANLTSRIQLMGADRDFAWPEQIGRRGNGNPGNGFGGGSMGF